VTHKFSNYFLYKMLQVMIHYLTADSISFRSRIINTENKRKITVAMVSKTETEVFLKDHQSPITRFLAP